MSPGKNVELRSKYLKQLKDIQNLKDEEVLTPDEFQIEKDTTLRVRNKELCLPGQMAMQLTFWLAITKICTDTEKQCNFTK